MIHLNAARFVAGQIDREAEPERLAALIRAWGFDGPADAPLEATKPMAWSYERERRLIIQTDQHDMEPLAISFPPEAVKSIIVGELLSPENLALLQEIARNKYPAAKLRTARRELFTYKLRVE